MPDLSTIWHFDLYRLKAPQELYELGIEEALLGLTIIEWPEIASSILPIPNLTLQFDFAEDDIRTITLQQFSF